MSKANYPEMVKDLRRYFVQYPFPWKHKIIAISGKNDLLRVFDGQIEREVIDANSGCWGPMAIGYSNPCFLEELAKEQNILSHTVFASSKIIEFAKKITSIATNGFDKVLQVSCASHANEAAMRLSWEATGRWGMVTLKQGFHGHELNVLGLTSATWAGLQLRHPIFPHSAIIPNCYCYRCSFGLEHPTCNYKCAYSLEEVIKYGTPYPPAALIMEPIQQNSFNFPPSNEYFKILGKICKANEMCFIVDEAHYGGVGRLGEWFATQLFEIPADIIATGKGIGNGFPIGVVITKEEILERAGMYKNEKEYKKIMYTTHQFDPFIAAAGLLVIEYIEKHDLLKRSRELGKYILKELREIQKDSKIIGRVDGRGLYIGVELVKDKETKEPFLEAGEKFWSIAWEKGVFFPPGRGTCMIGIRPPLTIEKENVDKIVNVFADSVKEVERTSLK
jgi:4-aminobutyrate aminotransferase-like enzyme